MSKIQSQKSTLGQKNWTNLGVKLMAMPPTYFAIKRVETIIELQKNLADFFVFFFLS